MIRLEDAKKLTVGDILLDANNKRWKVNGKVRTWKRDTSRVEIPIKHGLYRYGYLTDGNLDYFRKEELV